MGLWMTTATFQSPSTEELELDEDDDIAQLLAEVQFLFRYEPWKEAALCAAKGIDTSEFFPVRGDSQRVARATCAACPVAAECRDYADRSGTEWGIWGGEIRKRGPWPFLEQDYWSDIRSTIPKKVGYDLD